MLQVEFRRRFEKASEERGDLPRDPGSLSEISRLRVMGREKPFKKLYEEEKEEDGKV